MFTAYTDRVIEVEAVKRLCSVNDVDQAALMVNSVTDKFLAYTGRVCWKRGAGVGDGGEPEVTTYPTVFEYRKGMGEDSLILHGGPVLTDTDNDMVITRLESGAVVETLSYNDNDFYLMETGAKGGVVTVTLASGEFAFSNGPTLKFDYVGGFATVPGDVTQLAVEQIRYELRRMEGHAGVTNLSRGGESSGFETEGLLKVVTDGLKRYKVI